MKWGKREKNTEQFPLQLLWVAKFAFPDDEGAPAGVAKLAEDAAVAGDVALELIPPEGLAGCRDTGQGTAMVPMPEAAMDQDDRPIAGQDDVGRTGQVLAMQAETVAKPMQEGAHGTLRPCVR
jgi:hypothetical protein